MASWWPSRIVVMLAILVVVAFMWKEEDSFSSGVSFAERQPGSTAFSSNPEQESIHTLLGTSSSTWQGDRMRSFHGKRQFSKPGTYKRRESTASSTCTKWVVITTISQATELMQQLALLKDWCTVVVGDMRSPANFTLPKFEAKMVYLSPKDQQALPFRIVKHLPWNHFGRKNIGYLYAIQHGARVLWDTDDDNLLATGQLPWRAEGEGLVTGRGETPAMAASTTRNFNPYALSAFGAQMEGCKQSPGGHCKLGEVPWPRGFPLDEIRRSTSHTVPHNKIRAPAVLQSLANHEPDVDAIFRLTRSHLIHFDDAPHIVVLPAGLMAPWNAQATLFHADAFWGLLLPVTVHGRVSDIWRSFMTQRLMWNCGLSLGFATPVVRQVRNPHTYLGDFRAEQPLYERAGRVAEILLDYQPSSASFWESLPAQMEDLTIELFERGVLGKQDVDVAQAWLKDLMDLGLELPQPRRHRSHHVSPAPANENKTVGDIDPVPDAMAGK